MLTALGWLARSFLYIAGAALGVIVCLVAGSAIMRYVVGSPFGFTEEVVGLLFASMAFLSIAYCALFDREIRVDILHNALPGRLQRAGQLIAVAALLIFAAWIGWLAFDFIVLSYDIGARTDMTGITLWPWMSLFLVMVAGLLLSVFWRASDDSVDEQGTDLR